ncbi:hypothetical protein MVEN_01245000 [Mycena venus]|uniref:F-box domain-containing protein n=1 Tax=Mycena venus TaxID=2733690 RepID=A0A8H7CZ58_9AGAR|nr:hypothetical protein MVEN_01245000 [Mycena venus]
MLGYSKVRLGLLFRLGRRKRPDKSDGVEDLRGDCCTLPQELVDEWLFCLSDPIDFRACALVCRSWSGTALRLLYKAVAVTGVTRRYIRLWNTLRTSPHLVSHIHSLVLHRGPKLKIEAFEKVCNFPFTHLENVSITHDRRTFMTLPSAFALQRLFSLPTLRRMALECNFRQWAAFLPIWIACSSTIRHLELRCVNYNPTFLPPAQKHSSPLIVLESLRLGYLNFVDGWLQHHLCPFDFSRLSVLAIDVHSSVVSWPQIAPALQTIEALEFASHMEDQRPIDLSLFPNLQFLHISVYISCTTLALAALSTITSSSRVREIIFSIRPPRANACAQLDSEVAGLPLQHAFTVGLEMGAEVYARWAPHFSRLNSRNLLCRTDYDWFEKQRDRKKLTITTPAALPSPF